MKKESYHGVFFGYQTVDGGGVIDNEGYELVEPLWIGISWDGIGGFTSNPNNAHVPMDGSPFRCR